MRSSKPRSGGVERESQAITEGCPAPTCFLRISWEDLVELCRDAAARASREFRPEVVVAVARAGYVPGALVACLLRRDMVTLRLPSPVADGDPPVPEEIVASLAPLVAGRRALVVDEVNGTGGHLRRAQEAVRRAGASGVRTLTLLARRSGPAPDYCGAEGDVCVLQPWVARVIPW